MKLCVRSCGTSRGASVVGGDAVPSNAMDPSGAGHYYLRVGCVTFHLRTKFKLDSKPAIGTCNNVMSARSKTTLIGLGFRAVTTELVLLHRSPRAYALSEIINGILDDVTNPCAGP